MQRPRQVDHVFHFIALGKPGPKEHPPHVNVVRDVAALQTPRTSMP